MRRRGFGHHGGWHGEHRIETVRSVRLGEYRIRSADRYGKQQCVAAGDAHYRTAGQIKKAGAARRSIIQRDRRAAGGFRRPGRLSPFRAGWALSSCHGIPTWQRRSACSSPTGSDFRTDATSC
ncbi:hypothetical protein RSP797_19400 [Ralstonia solanacearum]|nr:hypothetical protein RSP797_19400 [Ralstonia solanacearum]